MFRLSRLLGVSFPPAPRAPHGAVRNAIVNVTGRCNLRCVYCYAAASPETAEGLSEAQVAALARELAACGFNTVTLSGGEPLAHPGIFRIGEDFRGLGFYVALSTNGTLLADPATAAEAARRFDYVGISLDGDEPLHDSLRGAGSYARTLAGIRRTVAAGVPVGLRISLTRRNAAGVRTLLDLAAHEGARKLYVSHIVPSGRAARDLLAPRETLARTMLLLIEAALAGSVEIVTGNLEADAAALRCRVEERQPDRLAALDAALARWGGNRAGERIVNVDWRGDIRPDPFCPPVGNIADGFRHVWETSPVLLALRDRESRLHGPCASCRHLAICRGGSRGRAHGVAGDLFASDPSCYLDEFRALLGSTAPLETAR